MKRKEKIKTMRDVLKERLKTYPEELSLLSLNEYIKAAGVSPPPNMTKCYISKKYLVQVYEETGKPIRLTINRTMIDKNGEWIDGITWDEIQDIKNKVGYSDYDCVEIYPAKENLVNVGNMRHIWVMNKLLDFSWKKR